MFIFSLTVLFQFSPDDNAQLLAVSSWEGTVRIYHFPAGPVTALEKRIYTHAKPVLACTFSVSYNTFDLSFRIESYYCLFWSFASISVKI